MLGQQHFRAQRERPPQPDAQQRRWRKRTQRLMQLGCTDPDLLSDGLHAKAHIGRQIIQFQ